MAFERKERPDDQITLFKNDDRRDEKDPQYKGQGKVSGREFWASAWVNKSREGNSYMKIKLKPKQEQRRETYSRQQQEETTYRRAQEPLDDEIPF